MRSKNLIVLGSALILALLLFGVAWLTDTRKAPVPGPSAPSLTADAWTPAPAATPAATAVPTAATAPTPTAAPTTMAVPTATADATAAASDPSEPADAYLVVTVNNMMYQPIPLTRETSYTLTRKDIGAVNVVHVTPDSVFMESSTCEGHDCVKQGTVSLENRSQRVLGNMIICLPNKVSLELYTPEEAQDLLSANGTEAP